MTFLHPSLAVAAVLVGAIPILLHLLLRRPRSTEWPSTMLLRLALERLRRRRRIEAWILLLLRAAGICLVGLAMAGPFMGGAGSSRGARELWLVIDDGATSAERLSEEANALSVMRDAIESEIASLGPGDRVALVRASVPARVEVAPTTDLQKVRGALRTLEPRPVPSDLMGALESALPSESDAPPREVLLASTLRRGSVRPDRPLPASWRDRATSVRWRSLRPPAASGVNRWIERVEALRSTDASPVRSRELARVELRKSGPSSGRENIRVRSLSGEILDQSDATWNTESTQLRKDVPLRAMKDRAWMVSVDPDIQPLDDSFPLIDRAGSAPKVAVIGRGSSTDAIDRLPPSGWVTRAMEAAGVAVREVDAGMLGVRPPDDSDVVILCRADLLDAPGRKWIGRHVRDGGLVVAMPTPGSDAAWVTDLARETGIDFSLDAEPRSGSVTLASRQPRSPILSALGAEIDALAEPVSVQRRWTVRGTDTDPILNFSDGEPAVLALRSREGRGLLVMFAFPIELDCTDLPLRPLMVPLMQEIARQGRAAAAGTASSRSGEIASLGPSAAGGLLRCMESGRSTVIEVGPDGRTQAPIPAPGIWKIEQRDGRERWIAVRLDPESASVEPVGASEIEAWRSGVGTWRWIDEVSDPDRESPTGESRWTFPMMLTAIMLLVAESLWSRRSSPRPVAELRS